MQQFLQIHIMETFYSKLFQRPAFFHNAVSASLPTPFPFCSCFRMHPLPSVYFVSNDTSRGTGQSSYTTRVQWCAFTYTGMRTPEIKLARKLTSRCFLCSARRRCPVNVIEIVIITVIITVIIIIITITRFAALRHSHDAFWVSQKIRITTIAQMSPSRLADFSRSTKFLPPSLIFPCRAWT